MAITDASKQHREQSSLCRLFLLLFLAGFQPVLSSDGAQAELHDEEQPKVSIVGPNYVTVGVPSSLECVSNCSACNYSMSLDGELVPGRGDVVAFTVENWTEAVTVACRVTNYTVLFGTATKQLQVLAGPSRITISGPNALTEHMTYSYTCSAYCRPACTYTWETSNGYGGEGSMIVVTPRDLNFGIVTCIATNTVSGLFASASQTVTTTRSSGQTVLGDLRKVTSAVLLSIISASYIL